MATLAQRLQDAFTRVGTEAKALRTLVNGNAADLTALATTAKNNLVAALNEVLGIAQAASTSAGNAAHINDAATAVGTVWSSQKVQDQITAAIQQIEGSATPAALDTLRELADAIGDDANFAATITAALGQRVRVDAVQAFTAGQKAQARANIGADITSADIGNPDADLVAAFNAALV